MRIVLLVLCILMGLLFVNAGLDKIFHYMPKPEDMPLEMLNQMKAMAEIKWLLPLVSIAEIVGGILIMIPRTRAIGALILLPIVIGILITNFILGGAGLAISLVILLVLLWIMTDNRKKYMQLL